MGILDHHGTNEVFKTELETQDIVANIIEKV